MPTSTTLRAYALLSPALVTVTLVLTVCLAIMLVLSVSLQHYLSIDIAWTLQNYRELLGNVPLPLRPGGDLDEDAETALQAAGEPLPDFDLMAETALAQEAGDALVPSELDPDYADLDQAWRAA